MKKADLKKLIKASKKLLAAKELITSVKEDLKAESDWGSVGDLAHFESQIQEILLTDQAEAGFLPYLIKIV